jgi:predicted nucleotidyltransferase
VGSKVLNGMNMLQSNQIMVLEKNLVPVIQSALPGLKAVYLFGSTVTGEMHGNSDIDLALWSGRPLSALALWELRQQLETIAQRPVDLIDLNNATTVMRMQVISKGKRLYCQDFTACEQFEDFIFSDYARLNEERHEILESIRQQGRIYG